ncbi:winged helix-turn-helix domain-containing tetratricopeptide repeat protein [Rhizobium ruizarguesonis]|uniref:winged helix-turn-helix domain-containing tetratricopeptide repeat protein n=1 Tax=Rhizobium ruizarguesonis TaxID=2081791 RepID=UPI0010325E47|nr:winged helix-turn-helix domain-containing protein [Rhizobium ruizarguesonis]TAY64622.1 hypothetical protein ELH84_28270 [Rhizobium ruizarguesonis]
MQLSYPGAMELDTNSFGSLGIDPSTGTVQLRGGTIAVGSRGIAILRALMEAGGVAVPKEELLGRGWPDSTVGEANLSVQIAALRKALGPRPDTVPRVGYRIPLATSDVLSSQRNGALLAVMPFDDLSSDGVEPFFAQGVGEDIITALSRFTTLSVLSRNASFALREGSGDFRAKARALSVDYLLTGSFSRRGHHVRLTIQLVDVEDGRQLLTDCHDGDIEALFDFQDRIVEAVAGFAEPGIKRAEIQRVRRKPPAAHDAYGFYLQALPHFRGTSDWNRAEAIRLLELSIARDDQFPIGLAHAAWAYERQDTFGPGMSETERQRALDLAERALLQGDDDPFVDAICALVFLNLSGEVDRSLAMLANAKRRCPHNATVLSLFAFANVMVGNVEDGRQAYLQALKIAPGALDNYELQVGVAIARLFQGEFEDSISWSLRALAQNGEWFGTYWILVAAYVGLGRVEQATWVALSRPPRSRSGCMRRHR